MRKILYSPTRRNFHKILKLLLPLEHSPVVWNIIERVTLHATVGTTDGSKTKNMESAASFSGSTNPDGIYK